MWSLRLSALVALLVLAGCGGGGSQTASGDGGAQPTSSAQATGDLSACAGQVQDAGRNCYAREIQVIVDRAGDKPLPAVQQAIGTTRGSAV